MTKVDESRHPGEQILSEAKGTRSVEKGILASGQNLGAGTVLGVITATGKYTQLNAGATDGSQNAAAVLFAAVDASSGDQACVVHIRDCEVDAAALAWPDGISGPDQLIAQEELTALGIVQR